MEDKHPIIRMLENACEEEIPLKPKEVWRIYFQGKMIQVVSGKYQWPSIGASKAALKNHFNGRKYWDDMKRLKTEDYDNAIAGLVQLGELEFRRVL